MLVRNGRFVYTRTPDEVRRDFAKLRDMHPEDMVDRKVKWVTRSGCPAPKPLWLYRTLHTGQMLSEYHNWRHRVRTPNAHHPSGQAVLNRWKREPEFLHNMFLKSKQHNSPNASDEFNLWDTIRLNSALHTTSHFRATVSKHLCETTGAQKVLDVSCGWCDRLTGFLASPRVTHITVVDPRAGSIDAAKKQHAFVGSTAALHAYQDGAEVVLPTLRSKSVDLIVSSPPFFALERYGEDEKQTQGQIWTKCQDNDDFVRVFLEPVIRHCARLLVPGGVLALNVDDNPKEGVWMTRPTLDLAKRHGLALVGTCGMLKGSGILTGGYGAKADPVYVFRKARA